MELSCDKLLQSTILQGLLSVAVLESNMRRVASAPPSIIQFLAENGSQQQQ